MDNSEARDQRSFVNGSASLLTPLSTGASAADRQAPSGIAGRCPHINRANYHNPKRQRKEKQAKRKESAPPAA